MWSVSRMRTTNRELYGQALTCLRTSRVIVDSGGFFICARRGCRTHSELENFWFLARARRIFKRPGGFVFPDCPAWLIAEDG